MPRVPSSARCVATDALVIGYGSDLRGDDAAGRLVAEAIDAQSLVFVDASIDDSEVTVRDLEAAVPADGVMTHHADPAMLLSMVPSVGIPPERAYVVSIPATNLDIGTELSEDTARAVDEAVEVVLDLLAGR